MSSTPKAIGSRPLPRVYQRPRCPFCRRLRAYLTEKGLDVDLVDFVPDQHQAALEALNPKRQVPTCLMPDGLAVFESFVIMEYLEELHPEPSLMPKTPADRARMRLLFDLSDNRVAPAMIGFIRCPKNYPDRSGCADELIARLAEPLQLLGDHTDYALSGGFSIADLSVPMLVYRAVESGLEPARLPERIRRWCAAVLARPSVAELFPRVSFG